MCRSQGVKESGAMEVTNMGQDKNDETFARMT